MGFRRAKSTQGNTNCQKNIFEDDQVPGHHPRALREKTWLDSEDELTSQKLSLLNTSFSGNKYINRTHV